MKAPVDQQKKLLDLQKLDTEKDQIEYAFEKLEHRDKLEHLQNKANEYDAQQAKANVKYEDYLRQLARLEEDERTVRARIERNKERENTSSSVRDITALEGEIASLLGRCSELEDAQLELMELIEHHRQQEQQIKSQQEQVQNEMAVVRDEYEQKKTELAREKEALLRERTFVIENINADLVALYEKQHERYGVGASLLRGSISLASNMTLTQIELEKIRSCDPEDVILCPDSNAILVRD